MRFLIISMQKISLISPENFSYNQLGFTYRKSKNHARIAKVYQKILIFGDEEWRLLTLFKSAKLTQL